jgi:3'-phosphoadenosine 5'-phosphosulfate sulfotransferase (PAPS reductase)/FAD synthetase
MKYILSFSGGKDSTYLLLELIRRGCPLDEVLFFDTGWEYDVMYEHVERCKELCDINGIKFVTLHPDRSFDYMMFEHVTRSGKQGYSWCGGPCRWGTRLKITAINKYIRRSGRCLVYVGIAADEVERLDREIAYYKRFPLVDWGITEEDCLRGCYEAGFDWGGMYEHLDRLSCKFCANKNLKELRNVRCYYPKVWGELKDYQTRTYRPYKGEGKSVFDLEKRFEFEDELRKQGRVLNRRDFFTELKNR